MRLVDRMYQVMVSELAQRSLDGSFASDFPPAGRFVPVEVKGRRYWYFDSPCDTDGKTRRYVGPVEDPAITERVERFKDLKADARSRRKLVSTLIREAYLPQPDRMMGDVVQAMAEAGFFRLRGVLVGSAAFQTYAALLGVRLPDSAMQTGDADFAQFHAISAAVDDSMPPVLDVIRQVDETFREIPHPSGRPGVARYVARSGFQVEFLTPNTGSTAHDGKPARMPALGGAAAIPLCFLDFLIHQPVRAILLHGFGVPVLVPAPERFAIHKLILPARRRTDRDGTAKHRKDLRQAGLLAEALALVNQQADLAAAYAEAWDRGPAWREAMLQGIAGLDPAARTVLLEAVDTGLRALGDDPRMYQLDGEGIPVHGQSSDAEPRHD